MEDITDAKNNNFPPSGLSQYLKTISHEIADVKLLYKTESYKEQVVYESTFVHKMQPALNLDLGFRTSEDGNSS